MSHNEKISDLRGELFGMLRTLRDPNQKVDIERFRLGNDVAQTIINSARVEVDYIRTLGPKAAHGTDFISADGSDEPPALPDGSASDATP